MNQRDFRLAEHDFELAFLNVFTQLTHKDSPERWSVLAELARLLMRSSPSYFRRPEMLEWIGHQLDPSLTPEQVQAAFDALVRRGVLRPMIRGVWELETSDPELLWWILSLDAEAPQREDLGAHDSR